MLSESLVACVVLQILVTAAVCAANSHSREHAAAAAAPRCPGAPNGFEVFEGAPVFLRRVVTGKAFIAGNGTDTFYIQHLYGTAYEMGLAHGQLFSLEIAVGINQFYDWIEGQIETALPFLPAYVAGLVADFGMPIALEWSWNNTKNFTHQRYVDEMDGIADGAGMARQDIYNVNMIAELIKAQCSIIGANGNATATSSTLRGGLAHLRTLDGMGGSTMPIKDYAVVSVYHPSDGSPTVAVFGWLSFAGCVTGFGEYIGIGEKFWGNHSSDIDRLHGQAWTFVTRDVLSATSFADAQKTLEAANRTCAVHLGIGSHDGQFAGVEVAAEQLTWFNDTSINYPEHPALSGLVYWDKYAQPTTSYCFPDLFREYYGHIDAEILATIVAPMAQTGSLHAAVFDYPNKVAYFANARKTNATDGIIDAYGRQYTRLNMAALFNETLQ